MQGIPALAAVSAAHGSRPPHDLRRIRLRERGGPITGDGSSRLDASYELGPCVDCPNHHQLAGLQALGREGGADLREQLELG